MSTIRGKLVEYLTECGLMPKEAGEIIDAYSKREECKVGHFNDPVDGYPPQLLDMVKRGVRQEAIKWIDTYQPGLSIARSILTDV